MKIITKTQQKLVWSFEKAGTSYLKNLLPHNLLGTHSAGLSSESLGTHGS